MKGNRIAIQTAIVLAGACTLAGCSSEEPTQDEPSASGCSEVTSLRMLRFQGDTLDIAIEDYKTENPCVQISLEEVPFGQLTEKISVSAASSDPPDLIMYDGPFTNSYAANGILLPLDEYISDEHLNDILPATRDEHSYGDSLYSPGLEQSTMALFYNKDVTDELGIDPPQEADQAWTWEEALDAFIKVQESALTQWALAPSAFGDGTPGDVYRDLIMTRSMGDPNASPDSSAFKTFQALAPDGATADGYLNSDEAVQGAQFYQDLFEKHQVTPKAGIPDAFISGTAAFGLEPPFMAANLEQSAEFEWGVTPLPYFETPITHTGSITIGVSAKTEHPDEAAAFVMFATSPEQSLKYSENYGSLPVRKSVLDQMPEFQAYPMNVFADSLTQFGQPRPPTPAFQEYSQIVSDALGNIALGADPRAALDGAVEQLQPILDRYQR